MRKRLLLLTVILIFCVVNASFAGEFLGNICWSWKNNIDEIGKSQVGIYHIGGFHFLVSGTYVNYSIGTPDPLNGNAELIDNELRFVFTTYRDYGPAVQKMSGLLKINLSNLSGTFSGLQTYMEDGGKATDQIFRGSVIPISCP